MYSEDVIRRTCIEIVRVTRGEAAAVQMRRELLIRAQEADRKVD